MIRTDAIIRHRFFVGHKRFTTLTVPAFVGFFINIWLKLFPDILHRGLMTNISCPHEVSIASIHFADKIFKLSSVLINISLRLQASIARFNGDFVAMFVSPYLKLHLITQLTLVTRPNIRNQIIHGIANVRASVNVRNSGSDVKFRFHKIIISEKRFLWKLRPALYLALLYKICYNKKMS